MLVMEHPRRTIGPNYGQCLHEPCGRHTARDIHGLCQGCAAPPVTLSTRVEADRELARRYPGLKPSQRKPKPRTVTISPREHTAALRLLDTLTEQEHHNLTVYGWLPHQPGWTTKHTSSNTLYPTFMGGIAKAVARGEHTIRKTHP